MTTFEDGPARGQTLMLRSAPLFLRVVIDPSGKADALDQAGDTPRPDEKLFAYVLTSPPQWAHIRASKGRGGVYVGGTYRLIDPQPAPDKLATFELWAQWTRHEAIVPEFAREAMARGSWK